MQSFPQPLSAAQEASYLRQYQNGDMHARDILIERNLRLVAHIVKKYIHSGKETDELISIGIIGLVKAVNTYNFDKGSRLATYAARCIDNELLMLMRGDKKRSREVSLYDPIGTDKEGNEITLLSIIEHNNEDVVEQLARKQSLQKLSKIISEVLTPREYFVVIRRYGLFGHSESTQRELASQLISPAAMSPASKKKLLKSSGII